MWAFSLRSFERKSRESANNRQRHTQGQDRQMPTRLYSVCMFYNDTRSSALMCVNESVYKAENELKVRVISPFPDPIYRFLSITAVFNFRRELSAQSFWVSLKSNTTVESKIGPVLSSKNVHLYSPSRNLRFYIASEAAWHSQRFHVS